MLKGQLTTVQVEDAGWDTGCDKITIKGPDGQEVQVFWEAELGFTVVHIESDGRKVFIGESQTA